MAPTETQRFRLRERLGDLLEDEYVTTLMESLPPVGWDKLATKEDLATLEERLDARFTVVDARFTAVEAKIDKGLARQTFVMLVALAAAFAPIYIALFAGAGG